MIVRWLSVIAAVVLLSSRVVARDRASDDIILTGREATGLRLAVEDFLQHRYSTSGDLTHYRIQLHRGEKQLEVIFIPDIDSRGPYPGGRTDFGPEMHYTVSLMPPKILSALAAQ